MTDKFSILLTVNAVLLFVIATKFIAFYMSGNISLFVASCLCKNDKI